MIKKMTDIMAYRGPDDDGLFFRGPVGLGHRRLSIIDLSSAGHQPMMSHDQTYSIVFNGEIYNYLELRDELSTHGCLFHTRTDTEVILEAYRIWGYDCINHFNGMWAFVIYDINRGILFLSRDRFGIKPLYCLVRPDVFAFASEIKSILAAFPEERRPNLPIIQNFLPEGSYEEGPETFFENISSLRQAHNAVYDLGSGDFSLQRYWDLDIEAFRKRWISDDPVEALMNLLDSAVRLHMRSDVPVGTCLSGGVDSSTIVGLMSRLRSDPVYTFSGIYPDRDCDEKRFVDLVNRHTGARANLVYPEPRGDLADTLSHITWHQDEPTAGPGLYTQYFVMQRASSEIKVILDGQGGDELFAGYLPYFALHIQDLVTRNGPAGRLKAMILALEVARYWGSQWLRPAADTLLGSRLSSIARRMLRKTQASSLKESPQLLHPSLNERCKGREIIRKRGERLPSALDNTLYWHIVEQSIPGLLHYEDRNSMAFSIEARVPLLDYRIVEFALALGASYKINGSWTKWILRKCASRILPPEVAWRRSKMGYPTPFGRWLRQDADRDPIRELILSSSFLDRELVTREAIESHWEAHQKGAAENSWLLYRLATLELWHRQFIDSFAPAPAPRGFQSSAKEPLHE